MHTQPRYRNALPFKSVAGALLFSVLLGPIGLLYGSVVGGSLMMMLVFVSVCLRLYVAASIFWMASCVWSVASVNRYNKKILREINMK